MLRKELGDAAFFKILKSYATSPMYKYNSSRLSDFLEIARKISGKNIDWFANQWIYGAGYPVYDVKWEQNFDGLVNICIQQQTTDSSVDFFRSKIPLMLHGSNGEKTLFVLNN